MTTIAIAIAMYINTKRMERLDDTLQRYLLDLPCVLEECWLCGCLEYDCRCWEWEAYEYVLWQETMEDMARQGEDYWGQTPSWEDMLYHFEPDFRIVPSDWDGLDAAVDAHEKALQAWADEDPSRPCSWCQRSLAACECTFDPVPMSDDDIPF